MEDHDVRAAMLGEPFTMSGLRRLLLPFEDTLWEGKNLLNCDGRNALDNRPPSTLSCPLRSAL